MKDRDIRRNFHRKALRHHHANKDTLVIDELGLRHGTCRADIAVINGHIHGFEIKSDEDSLCRLEDQVDVYGAVFDYSTIVTTTRHLRQALGLIPGWWGIIICSQGCRGGINFDSRRQAGRNPEVDPVSVAELLWRDEAREILLQTGLPGKLVRERRSLLYELLTKSLPLDELRKSVRTCLKSRKNWRHHAQPAPDGDLCLPSAT
jgi:hypothetical protein